jgi:hypothetical protein
LAATKEKKVISSVELDGYVSGTAVAANGVLYITTRKSLYAVKNTP